MAWRVWIIAERDKVEQADIDDAKLNHCPEIVNGIPPTLRDIISEGQLPYAYEEPTLPLPIPARDLATEIDDLKARIEKLERAARFL